jgi:hypothetical protein
VPTNNPDAPSRTLLTNLLRELEHPSLEAVLNADAQQAAKTVRTQLAAAKHHLYPPRERSPLAVRSDESGINPSYDPKIGAHGDFTFEQGRRCKYAVRAGQDLYDTSTVAGQALLILLSNPNHTFSIGQLNKLTSSHTAYQALSYVRGGLKRQPLEYFTFELTPKYARLSPKAAHKK